MTVNTLMLTINNILLKYCSNPSKHYFLQGQQKCFKNYKTLNIQTAMVKKHTA